MYKSISKRLFYFKSYDAWDIISISIYLLLTGYIYFGDPTNKQDWLFYYAFGTHLTIYYFNYKSLRKLNVWLIWVGFSIIHIHMFMTFNSLQELQMIKGFAGYSLQFTLPLLLLFQLLRYISLKYQNQELVSLSRTKTDLLDKRRITKIDVLCFFTYMIVAILLDVYFMLNQISLF